MLRYGNGDVYEGEFVGGKKEGQGRLTLSKGRDSFEYVGSFHNDKIHGEGRITYANGDTFEGSFSDSKKHGSGRYVNKGRKEIYEGTWDMDMKQGHFF